jgi:hypothetical protein
MPLNFLNTGYFADKVGIGTASPQKALHIEGASGASASQLLVCGPSDTVGDTAGILLRAEGGEADSALRAKGGIFFEREAANGLGKLHLCNNGSNNNDSANLTDAALTIAQTKNIGIGTASPDYLLDLYKSTGTSASTTGTTLQRLWNNVDGDLQQQKTFIDFVFQDTNDNQYPQVRIGAEVGQNGNASTTEKEGSGAFVVYTNNAPNSTPGTNVLAERFRVDYKGDVGIGTPSPDYPLEIVNEPTNVSNVLLGLGNPILAPNTRDSWIKMFGSQNTTDKTFAIGNLYGKFVVNYLGTRATDPEGGGTKMLTVDGSTGNVGIGLTTPTGNLSMNSQIGNGTNPPSTYITNTADTRYQSFFNSYYVGATDQSGPYPRYFDMVATGSPDDTNGGSNIRFFTTGVVAATGAQSRMAITSRGRVGIGTDDPDGELEVITSTIVSGASDTVNNVLIGLQAANRPTIILDTADTTYTNRTWNITNVGSAGKLFIGRNGLDVMVMDNSGNVGIGTDDPGAKLDVFSAASFRADVATGNPLISIVNNTATSSAAGTATIKFTQANTQAGGKIVSARDGNYSSGATRSSNLQFYTSSAATDSEKMRINSIGDVGINTTTPFEKLDVNGNIYAQNRIISADATNANENLLEQSSIKISNKNDIYGNLTKVIISPYEAAYTSDGTGGSTVRLGSETAMTPGAIHTFSVYYKDLVGSLNIDLYDVAASGSYTSAVGTAAAPVSGRLYGYAQKASTGAGAGYNFVDINLTNNGSVTLLNPKVETGKVATEFIATTEEEGIPQTTTTNNLRATGSIQMGADDTTATADKAGTMRYRTGTEYVVVTGKELITDGDFASSTYWGGTNAAVASGVATFTGTSGQESTLFQQNLTIVTTSGTLHALTYTVVSNNLQGSAAFYAGYRTNDECIQAQFIPMTVGTHTVYGNSAGTGNGFSLHTSVGFTSGTLVIDNVSVYAVTAEDASYADMCMQTALTTYEWVNIVRNTY